MKNDASFFPAARFLVLLVLLVLSVDLYVRTEEPPTTTVPPPDFTKILIERVNEVRGELDTAISLLEECFDAPVELDKIRTVPVTITAYTSTVDQCDDTPYLTASHTNVRIGIIAVSDDLLEEFGLKFGQRVLIPGHGLFEIQDRMNPRWRKRVDIWLEDRQVALRFGKQEGTLMWLPQTSDEKPKLVASATEY